jgi:hypothetical protein
LFCKGQDIICTYPARCLLGAEFLYWEIKRLESEVDHSPPFSAEVKNEWSYNSAPRTCLHDVDRDDYKPEYVTAVVELLMIGVRTPETC